MKALLIIDMQRGCVSASDPALPELVSRINALAANFRNNHYPVIYVRHDGRSENELIPHTDDWQLLPELQTSPTDRYIEKTANDSFYQTPLSQVLAEGNITELYITGSATDFCVDATIKSALSKDYQVTVVADCHTTDDKPNLPAPVLIDYYNWIWSALAPTKYKITVTNAHTIRL